MGLTLGSGDTFVDCHEYDGIAFSLVSGISGNVVCDVSGDGVVVDELL